jgi:uncharacterized membrane protein
MVQHFDFFCLRVLGELLFQAFLRMTSRLCVRTKKPRGSYLLVEVSRSHLEKRQRSFRHSKRSAVRNRLGTPRAWRRRLLRSHTARRTTGDKLVAPALDSFSRQRAGVQNRRERFRDPSIAVRSKGLEMFWITARPPSESHHRQIAEFVPKRFVAQPPLGLHCCRQTETARDKPHGISAPPELLAVGPITFRMHQSADNQAAPSDTAMMTRYAG